MVLYWNFIYKVSFKQKDLRAVLFLSPPPPFSKSPLYRCQLWKETLENLCLSSPEDLKESSGKHAILGSQQVLQHWKKVACHITCRKEHTQPEPATAFTSLALRILRCSRSALVINTARESTLLEAQAVLFHYVRAPGRLWSQSVKRLRLNLPPEVHRLKQEYAVGTLDGSTFNG